MPRPEELRAIRGHILARHEEFRKLVRARPLRTLMGELWSSEPLSRVPKGFPSDHPAADLIRCRRWTFYVTLDPALATTPRLLPEILKRFRAMTPFVEFLNEPVVAGRREQAARNFLL